MKRRPFGRTGQVVGEIGLGTWQLGADWGEVSDGDARAVLEAALAGGVDLLDTADVYGDGRSERRIGAFLRDTGRTERPPFVATKIGRRLDPHVAAGYTYDRLARHLERSRANLGLDTVDLVQLHCPPPDVYESSAVFDALARLIEAGGVRHAGVSVETIDEGLAAILHPVVSSVQIVFNIFRPRPAEAFLDRCRERSVAVIARVPLASGLLAGGIDVGRSFPADDHREYNRNGEAFDVGETFAGVPFESGLTAVEEIRAIVPEGMTMAQMAIRWVLMHDAVTCVIPGARSVDQVTENLGAAVRPGLSRGVMAALSGVYDRHIRAAVHHRW